MRPLLELGRGGMGVVYLAVTQGDAGFTKLSVVKRLRAELASDPRAVSMFLEEARLGMRLRHPNVVHTFDVGLDGANPFLEMEYLEGHSLDALRRKTAGGAAIPLDVAVWIIGQVLAGLDYAHELCDAGGKPLHLVHRDVSPHNVMLTYEGGVKLLDFGIAKVVDSTLETQSGVVKGKATYMAPEQARRGVVDRRADLFAVGVMLCEAIRGARFWGDQNEFEIFLHLRELELPPLPAAPAALAAICARALAPSPDDRYPTAAAFLADVDAYLDDRRASLGPRALAKIMTTLFADERRAARSDIESRLKPEEVPGAPRASDPPASRNAQATSTHTTSDAGVTKLRQRSEIRGLQRIAWVAIGLAVAASGAAGIVSWRSRLRAASSHEIASARAPGCASNRACTETLGKPALCRPTDGACVALETDECKLLAEPGDTDKDGALLVGAMFQLSGPAAEPIGQPSMRAVDLARRDFVQVARGLPSKAGDGPPRPIAIVCCDDANDSAKVARHLVTELQLPAVIGFGSSHEFIGLAGSLFVPRRVFAVPAENSSALITSISAPAGEPRLIFRTSLSSAAVAEPVAVLVANVLEPARRAELRGATRALRVAMLRRKSASGLAVGDALFAALHFNGKSALENGTAFRELSVAEPSDPSAGDSYGDAARELLSFLPDIVIYAGGDELTDTFFRPLEKSWPHGGPRPLYVALNSLAGKGAAFFTWLGRDAELRRRFLGIAAPANTPTNARFTMRYNQAYPNAITTTNLSPAAPYDAFYLVAYAAFAAGDGPTRGADLARAVASLLSPGKRIEVGPTAIFDAVAALRAGEHIDLNGAGGPLDFDLATGESPADYVFVCPGRDATGNADAEVESGMGFASADHALRGTLRCP